MLGEEAMGTVDIPVQQNGVQWGRGQGFLLEMEFFHTSHLLPTHLSSYVKAGMLEYGRFTEIVQYTRFSRTRVSSITLTLLT